MEYLIWGAGRGTQSFIDVYYSCYFYENPIKAIVDNDENKWGKIFFVLFVIDPQQIDEYSFAPNLPERIIHMLLLRDYKGA